MSKHTSTLILTMVLFLFAPKVLIAQRYYVDATLGNDSNDGISEATSWRTISKVNSTTFLPGDAILLKRGGLWREQLNANSSGIGGFPITYGAYGAGNNYPIISGADLVTGWNNEGGNIYSATLPIEPVMIYFDGVRGTPKGSYGQLNSLKDWHWESGALHVYSISNPGSSYTNPGIETLRRPGAKINQDNVILEDIELKLCKDVGVRVSANNVVIRRVYSHDNYREGITFIDDQGLGIMGGSIYDNIIVDFGERDGLKRDVNRWANSGSNIWSVSNIIVKPVVVYFDGIRGMEEDSQGNLNAVTEWYWNSKVLYVYSESNPELIYTTPGIQTGEVIGAGIALRASIGSKIYLQQYCL